MKVKAVFQTECVNSAFKDGEEYDAYMLYEKHSNDNDCLVQSQLVVIDKDGDAMKENDAIELYKIKFEVL